MLIKRPVKKYLWVWVLCLLAFYAVWFWLVVGLGFWSAAKEHWPIAFTMALGSYVAGSTPMGGGTVGFPILVLLFDLPASLGRDFSFAIQSIGMTSASIFIFCRRQPLALSVLKGAITGTIIGAPFGIFLIAPLIPELWIKITFAVIWASFGLLHLYRLSEIAGHEGQANIDSQREFRLGFLLGSLASTTVVAVTGVGIDMFLYAALVLLCRADLRIAIPTSVVVMAFASLYGTLIKTTTVGLQPGVFANWLAAAPIVALGAPLGVFIVGLIDRKPTLLFVALLCVGQFIWTCVEEFEALQTMGTITALVAVGVCLFFFEGLRLRGALLAGEIYPRKFILHGTAVSPQVQSDTV
jgi:uncharacterized membrane protein YfcA